MQVLFSQLTVGATFQRLYKIISVDIPNNTMVMDMIDSAGNVLTTVTVTLSTGAFSGTFASLQSIEVEPITQHFQNGDLIMQPLVGSEVFMVTGMSDDDVSVKVGTGGTDWRTSGDYVRVGHIDPQTVALV